MCKNCLQMNIWGSECSATFGADPPGNPGGGRALLPRSADWMLSDLSGEKHSHSTMELRGRDEKVEDEDEDVEKLKRSA